MDFDIFGGDEVWPPANVEDQAHHTDQDSDLGEEYPLEVLDPLIFGPAWRAQIEALEMVDSGEL